MLYYIITMALFYWALGFTGLIVSLFFIIVIETIGQEVKNDTGHYHCDHFVWVVWTIWGDYWTAFYFMGAGFEGVKELGTILGGTVENFNNIITI